SQGPTLDGRVKPDLVAPGSLLSSRAGSGCELAGMLGTSMATPLVAGAAALVRQYYMEGYYPSGERNASAGWVPSSALIKATLIGGAASLSGLEAANGLPIDPPPSFRQGWGRVDLASSLALSQDGQRIAVLDSVSIQEGEQHSYCLRSTGGPLSVTL
ncbi:hypothetical protein H632_c5088p0, partial [Helicosporidium sp. ATCC 50920]